MEIHKITDEKLEQLANDPKNIVYRYTDQKAPVTITSLPEVKNSVLELWAKFKEIRNDRTLTYKQARNIRVNLCKHDIKWRNFSASHPLIFDRVVDHRTGEKEIEALLYMICLKESEQSGKSQKAKQQLQAYLMSKFAVSEEEYRAQNKGEDVKIIDPNA